MKVIDKFNKILRVFARSSVAVAAPFMFFLTLYLIPVMLRIPVFDLPVILLSVTCAVLTIITMCVSLGYRGD